MAVKTTIYLDERHHRYLQQRVADGSIRTVSEGVASAIERSLETEAEAAETMTALAEELAIRAKTDPATFLDADEAFAAVLADLAPLKDR